MAHFAEHLFRDCMKSGPGVVILTLASMRKPCATDLSDAQWNRIEPHLPAPTGFGRPRTHSLREILNAVYFYVLKSGCQWRLLPHDSPRDGPPSPLLLQEMAYRRHLVEGQPGHSRTPQDSLEEGSSARRGPRGQQSVKSTARWFSSIARRYRRPTRTKGAQ
jgi:transposase